MIKIEDVPAQRENLNTYYIDMGTQYLGPPVAVGIINFLATLVFFILRCCCGKCQGKNGEAVTMSEYTKAEKLVPIVFFVIFSIAIMVVAASAYVGNDDISVGLTGTTDAAGTGLDDLTTFMTTSKDLLDEIQDTVEEAVEEASVTLGSTDWVAVGAVEIPRLLGAFSEKYASNELLADLDLQSVLDDAVKSSEDSVQSVVADFETALDTVKKDLVDVKDDIVEQTGEAIKMMGTLLISIEDMNAQIDDVQKQLGSTENFRKIGVLALFGFTIFLIILAYVGIIAGLTPCKGDDWTIHFMNLTWIFGSFFATLAFIVGGAALTISVFWSDTCHFSDLITADFGEYLDVQTATGMNACFQDTDLVEAYNMTEQLDFAGSIQNQLQVLEELDVSKSLTPAFESIEQVGVTINRDLDLMSLFAELNSLTSDGASSHDAKFKCAAYGVAQDHSFEFTEGNVRTPWLVHATGKTAATWSGESFARQGSESGLQYIQRVYASSTKCDPVRFDEAIKKAWTLAADTVQIKEDMFRDLGIDADLCAALGCPTDGFGSDSIKGFLSDYESQLVPTSLTHLRSLSIF